MTISNAKQINRFKLNFLIILLLWSASVITSLIWNINNINTSAILSVSLSEQSIKNLVMSHSFIWTLGFIGILSFYRQVRLWNNSHLELQKQLRESHSTLAFRVEQETKKLNNLSVAFVNSPTVILITDNQSKIEYVNPVISKISGYKVEELIGQTPAIFKSDLNDPKIYQDMNKTLAHKKIWHGEFINKRKDGSFYWISSSISPVLSANGEIQNFVAIQEDISQRKQAEQNLLQAKELAEQSNRAKSEFLSNMSHELRTPLNAILGFAEILEFDPVLDKKYKSSATEIHSAGKHLLRLVNDVLDLGKIESRQLIVKEELIALRTLVDQCLKLVAPLAENKQISLSFKPIKCDCTIKADYTRLKQIIINLLSNAIKYNKIGGKVTLNCQDCANQKKRIIISDTGFGILPDKQQQLFLPFNRLGAEQSNIEGTGIGLYITRQLIEMMGGKIGFESKLGKGSSFWIELAVNAEQNQQQTIKVTQTGTIEKNILYVDNNMSNINLLQNLIDKQNGLKLIISDSLEQVLDHIKNKQFSVLIIDFDNFAQQDINNVLKILADNNQLTMTVIAIATHNIEDYLSQMKFHAEIKFVSKPVNMIELLSLIKT